MRAAVVAIGAMLLAGPAWAERQATVDFFPVATIAGQTQAEVAKNFAKPDGKCETIKYGTKCAYKKGAVEIVFIGGKADWFTVYPTNQPYISSSVTALGLRADIKPDVISQGNMQWRESQAGLLLVQAAPGESGRVWFFTVKAKTP